MAGQVWAVAAQGGYLYSDTLSDILRMALQPLMRFRQHCHIDPAIGKHKGAIHHWNIFSKVANGGRALSENESMPEDGFTIAQGSLTLAEYGNSVPYTGVLDDLSKQPVEVIIHQVLKDDANTTLEEAAWEQWDDSLLTVTPASGNSETAITVEVTGTPTATNNVALGTSHVKLIVDEMKERNIPAFDGTNYGAIGRPATFRPVKDDLEALSMYTERGYGDILNGEIGRSYDGVRFFEQTSVDSEGWSNAKSDAAYFFGADTVCEGVAVPEEIRGKIPTDFGRSKGVAWYSINGFGIVHNQTGAVQNRIMKWASAA